MEGMMMIRRKNCQSTINDKQNGLFPFLILPPMFAVF